MMKLDQFYTKPEVARQCWRHAAEVLSEVLAEVLAEVPAGAEEGLFYIEPSAGDGAFLSLLPPGRCAAFDIAPRHTAIKRADFLKTRYAPPHGREGTVVIGNPPFGKRGKMAVDFVNKGFTMADTVAFIVPVIFRKHFIHKQIDAAAQLVARFDLPRNAFRTDASGDYAVNTEFQIWTKARTGRADLRLFSPPPIKHPDFEMYQYNNTKQALKMFDNDFDFAVPCQGFQDYSRRETHPGDCEKHKQWMLFKVHTRQARAILHGGIDYHALSRQNITTIPGFRKGDVVAEYMARAA